MSIRPHNWYSPWGRTDDATLREMFHAGATDQVIGTALGRTAGAIQQRRRKIGLLWSDATLAARAMRPMCMFPLPDIPETCEPIIPNPPQYRPWHCPRDADQIVRDGGQIMSWSSWLPMRARMAELEARDAARDARDAERYDVAFVDGQMRVRVREEVAA